MTPPVRMSAPALEANDVCVWRGARLVVDGVSFHLERGEAIFLAGANGAGRSTLLGALAGLVPRRGSVTLAGRTVPGGRPAAAVRSGLVLVPDRRYLFPGMTVEDNLVLGSYAVRSGLVRTARRAPELAAVYERFPLLAERRGQRAGTLSGGEQQMLALGRALVSRPAVLLLDEPFLGLAPAVTTTIAEVIAALRAEGRALVIVDDHPNRIGALADRVLVVAEGRVAAPS